MDPENKERGERSSQNRNKNRKLQGITTWLQHIIKAARVASEYRRVWYDSMACRKEYEVKM
jgi:hypothetical protein